MLSDVIALKEKYAEKWQAQPDSYWLMRLMQEVGELASSLAGDHEDTPEHELKQIASIALNWLDKRAATVDTTTEEERKQRLDDNFFDEEYS